MKNDPDIDIGYLIDSLKLTPEERFIRCVEFMEFSDKYNQHIKIVLENDHPDIYELK
ncbi:MAG: hypothetical protein GVY19_11885 [Bacteroidetes bacterium]|jgi:hypothetical protein|nr:hypothetical protein [Bacteroidota bacterium]